MRTRGFLRACRISGTLFLLFRSSVFSVLPSYPATLLDEAYGEDEAGIVDPLLGAAIMGSVRLVGALIAPAALVSCRKRTLFVVCGAGASLGLLAGAAAMQE